MSKRSPALHASRGYRNNNPLNIRIGSSKWKGEIPTDKNTDGKFEQFYKRSDGYRAAAKLILNYNRLYNIFTVQRIIERWAPAIGNAPDGTKYKNHTHQYIDFVCRKTGFDPNTLINGSNVGELVWAMAQFENMPPHTDSLDFVKNSVSEFKDINY
ncbi:hypothetical protein NVP1069O_19 [Vibrio phage 1.069.O._10N.286.49.F11]|uniref:Structural protein P5 n=7 Tax=Autolykiviridae TaxID=2184034 RepID=A0A2I7S897_9VIRU|nr:endolysin [Vibrio phage 1.008.O._10N.286.54.E5]AUR81647.1 hypothetical protein NVP1011O_18 [Vibrio phage 1.011.O._10N.286.49.B11]AUR83786.1 hypothetical protein NVP1040O_19 [Vibrio phage 1.040.O._10N.286.45.B9]AUR84665.1 hypothetical protein NVP1062O_19 [Vibrio phage 1.062.O._10N.286.55.C3]AUR85162.1 hypothetical protein NVP1069O_19 [Vibrio phage 1.069.O._10N.286.49.F11]AUR89590.1 hypothetical protein NVP1125O_19 [Vibrio phage 1.125.O._10N.286.49.F5]AUS02079.1 hypothetical protein NVP2092O